jgi:folylpolyglutamate synthase
MSISYRFNFLSFVVHTKRLKLSHFYGRRMSTAPILTYRDAIDALNSLQTNAAVLEAVRAAGAKLNPNAITEMIDYLRRVGLEVRHMSTLLFCL